MSQIVHWPKFPLMSKRYLPLVSGHETYKELIYWTNKKNDNLNKLIIKTFFLVWHLKSEMYKNWGNWTEETITVLSVSVKIKPLFWICSCSLLIQTTDSYPCMLLLNDCDTQLHLHLFQNINDNNYNKSHTHQQSHFLNQRHHSSSFTQLVLKSKVKEQNCMWCGNHSYYKIRLVKQIVVRGWGVGMIA